MTSKGKRRLCPKCGIPFYDLGNAAHPCPVCKGLSTTKPRDRAAKRSPVKKTGKALRWGNKNPSKTVVKKEEPELPSPEITFLGFFGNRNECLPETTVTLPKFIEKEGWYALPTEVLSAKSSISKNDVLFLGEFPNRGLADYICSPVFKGLGPSMADQLVSNDGSVLLRSAHSLDQLIQSFDLVKKSLLENFNQIWLSHGESNNLKILMSALLFSASQQDKIAELYGAGLCRVLNERPFSLVKPIPRLGFDDVTRLCSRLGIIVTEEDKTLAAADYFLSQTEGDRQHTCAPKEVLFARVSALVGLKESRVAEVILDNKDQFYFGSRRRKEVVSTLEARSRDVQLSAEFKRLQKYFEPLGKNNFNPGSSLKDDGIELSDEQLQAINIAAATPIAIITGGPGAGKTTMVRGLVEVLKSIGKDIKLCAPTGRAAKRISETPGMASLKPSTIHMFLHRQDNRQEKFDVMIVDESSMIDINLMLRLLKAIPDKTSIIFIGDADQLPPVGAGQPFKDLIEADCFPIARLTGNFRQDSFSETVKAARSVISGNLPQKSDSFQHSDFVFFDIPQDRQADKVLELYFDLMPKKLAVKPIDIQILSPQRPGHVGMNRLNRLIQAQTTHSAKPILTKKSGNEDVQIFVGDKIIFRKNNYELGVMNGDIGRVLREVGKKLIVEFESENGTREVTLEGKDKFDMDVAYATTIHSSQGSEYPGVIIPVTAAHHYMLSRNLLYTAITRGKKQVCLVGEWHAFEKAIALFMKDFRYTLLIETLIEDS
jgi:exodeoxyribonuclease V alpha subunit